MNVIAIEPMTDNVALLEATMCRNRDLNVSIIHAAIGERGTCRLFSGNINTGDCHLICNGDDIPTSGAREMYIYRGDVKVIPASDIIPAVVATMKIDTEGSECRVLDTLIAPPNLIVAETTFPGTLACVQSYARQNNCRDQTHTGETIIRC